MGAQGSREPAPSGEIPITGAARDYGPWAPIPELIERRAARDPGAMAVAFGDRELSYRELNARANRLARYLRSRGVDRERLVGVHLERSAELVVALLAILKAGGAYLPLDPAHPRDRLRLVLEEARPTVVLSARDLAGGLPPGESSPVVRVDADAPAWSGRSAGDLGVRLDPANAIYVLYTSGSTGRPKGVVNTHGGLANRLLWMQERYPLDRRDVVLQKTPFGFDVSAWEFFWPLMAGARLAVARPGEHRDPDLLAQAVARHGATADRIMPDPFAAVPGERMYRTGDLGRLRDGAIEYCGRTDDQVKVRGFRIELGEIQAAMAAHPDVAAAAVTVCENPRTGRYLAGYDVCRRGASLPGARLRDVLLRVVPEYMVPTTLTELASLPVTANGKLDRAALPAPGRTPTRAGAAPVHHVPPRTATERAIAAVWADLLGQATIGARDNFLDLGGHSMAAARIAARIRTDLGADLQVRDFYHHPVLERLAARVDELRACGIAGPPPIRRIPRDGRRRSGQAGSGGSAAADPPARRGTH